MIQRVFLLLIASAAIVWLALMFRPAQLQTRAVDRFTAGSTFSSQQVQEVAQLFRDARAHNPDTLPRVEEAYLYISTGSPRKAIPLLKDVLKREPDNYFAWKLLADGVGGVDPSLAARAQKRLKEIDPRGH